MIRRRFLGLMTLTGLSGVAALSARGYAEKKTVTYKVQGFTCITCATGLETLLQREKGILGVRASYPEGLAMVTYDAKSISQAEIVSAIESMGFKAQIV
jgi:Cu+-exporting ATPase